MSARLALLTPFAFPSVRGNAVTVDRIAHGLRERGVDLRVWDLSVTAERRIEAEVDDYRPSLIHAFHAYRTGPLALRLARRTEIPLVVTLTGTDANHDLFDPERASTVRRVLEGGARLVVFHESILERIAAALPDLRPRLVTVPQSVRFESGPAFDLEARWPLPAGSVLFLFPGGVRPVKNPRFPIRPLERLVARDGRLRLLYVGPLLDPAEGEGLLRLLAARPWARHIGAVPHDRMASLLARADVVVNCSVSEGGMANSVLESLALGRAVLASDIEGNRGLIADGVTGLLFRDEAEFEAQGERLLGDATLRARLGQAGRDLVEGRYPVAREIDGYLAVYQALLPVRSGCPHP